VAGSADHGEDLGADSETAADGILRSAELIGKMGVEVLQKLSNGERDLIDNRRPTEVKRKGKKKPPNSAASRMAIQPR
jgi:hypothetical protein